MSLPIEIISNILARLPVTYIARYKAVSKAWYNLISSLHFLHLHNLISQTTHYEDRIFLFVDKDGCLYFSNLDVYKSLNAKKINFKGYIFKEIVGSCNGLILCTCYINVVNDPENPSLVLVNPSTLQFKLVSNIEELSFDYNSRCYGFGYDSLTDDYKVVRVVLKKIGYSLIRTAQVGVYSLKSDCWKFIEHDFHGGFFFPMSGVLINNHVLHWWFYGVNSRVIWSFDVCTEQWSKVSIPNLYMRRDFPASLRAFDGHLCLLIRRKQRDDVFVMDVFCVGGEDSWVKLFDIPGSFPCPLSYSKSGSEILVVAGCRLFWYNPTKEIICREVKCHKAIPFTSQLIVCTRSLVRLPGSSQIS